MLLGINIGTTGTTAALIDAEGNLIKKNYSEYQFNVRAHPDTTDGAIASYVYMWKVDDGELTAFIPRGDLWEFVHADQDIFLDAPMVHWDLPGPGIYKITCIAGNVGYASGTTSISIEIPEFYEVET